MRSTSSGEADEVVNVGVSGPGVVRAVLADLPKDADITSVAEAIKATAFKITRAGELMAREASKRLGVQQGILDLSLAPTPAEGDSVAQILEAIGVGQCAAGSSTTAALAAERRREEAAGVMASSSVGSPVRRVHPVSEAPGTIRARPGAGSVAGEAGGHDLRVLGGPRHDRGSRRHVRRDHLRHHRR